METSAFPNLDYRFKRELGPGEVVLLTPEGIEPRAPAGQRLADLRIPVGLLRLSRFQL